MQCDGIDQIGLANPSVRYRLICYPLIIKPNLFYLFAVMVIYKKRKKTVWYGFMLHFISKRLRIFYNFVFFVDVVKIKNLLNVICPAFLEINDCLFSASIQHVTIHILAFDITRQFWECKFGNKQRNRAIEMYKVPFWQPFDSNSRIV